MTNGSYTLFYSYRLFEKQVSLIDGQASNYEVFTRELTTNDVVLMIGFSPYSRESLDVLEASRRAGCKIVALTDSPLSPLAQAANHTLYFSAQSPSFFPSVVSALGMAESLLALLVTRYGEKAVKQIAMPYLAAFVPVSRTSFSTSSLNVYRVIRIKSEHKRLPENKYNKNATIWQGHYFPFREFLWLN